MVGARRSSRLEIGWSDDALEMLIDVDEEGIARLTRLVPLPAEDGLKANRDRKESATAGYGPPACPWWTSSRPVVAGCFQEDDMRSPSREVTSAMSAMRRSCRLPGANSGSTWRT